MWREVLRLLKEKKYIPPQRLTAQLNISFNQLEECLLKLKNLGYQIEEDSYLGYYLISSPDRLFPWEIKYNLSTQILGRKIYYFENVESTQDIAFEKFYEGEGTIIVAEGQSKGRGREGRRWLSFPYKGIYFSLILKPEVSYKFSLISLLLSVSIAEAIDDAFGIKVGIKWPNDLLLADKKVGGVLIEGYKRGEFIFIVAGAGININNERKELPSCGISLKEFLGRKINRVDFFKKILESTERNYVLFKKESFLILEKWKGFNVTLGRRVVAISGNQKVEGKAFALDKCGYLLIKKDDGKIEKISHPQIFQQNFEISW